ncbi:hypothetical protein FS842_001486 [Serendipita sp. 407]|nr:hypothetical protein FS842_001486 [Serendipita sp. 407]
MAAELHDYDSFDAILHHIFKQTQGEAWFKPTEESLQAGVALRVENNPARFRVFPYENLSLVPFEAAVRALNPLVAVKIRSASVHAALATAHERDNGLYIDQETRIQIIETIAELPTADKEQSAAFVRDERVLICWSDNLDGIIPTCKEFEDKLIALVWKLRTLQLQGDTGSMRTFSGYGAETNGSQHTIDPFNSEKNLANLTEDEKRQNIRSSFLGWKAEKDGDEVESDKPAKRPTRLFAPIYNGLGAALALFHQNSKYYSAVKPAANNAVDKKLPHVTIQMPVYKESLTETIAPSCESLKKAMQTYARQGGTSSIMICDDGMQLIDKHLAEERKQYYADHGIGWIARPGHSSAPDGFKRAGRFKKASNMNYALKISLKLEEHLNRFLNDEQAVANARMHSHLARATDREQGGAQYWPQEEDEEESLEDMALKAAMDEVYAESESRFQPWGAGGRALRVGEIILIVDSDTIVPEDCLRDAAREMAESPELGVIQHESDVMQVSHDYFENGIAHFTRRINKAISFAAANGEVAAFVGHNAFLRWSAIQDVAFIDKADGERKIWSESNVSEDFDMALRLQLGGYIISMMAYMFSYYGIAAAFTLSLLNYLLIGWQLPIDGMYLQSFQIWVSIVFIFPVCGNIAQTLLEYRIGHRGLLASFWDNLKWIPFFFIFFGGLSIHLSKAILAHMFSYNITWGATKKEVERSNFFLEVPKILSRFRVALVVCALTIAGIIVLGLPFMPLEWKIRHDNWSVIVPLAIATVSHVLYPIILNPYLMVFSY